jgi:hypothetical protein
MVAIRLDLLYHLRRPSTLIEFGWTLAPLPIGHSQWSR